jgi:hypothetical protein
MDYTKRTWNSLTQLLEHIKRDGEELVVHFNGYELVTDKYRYGLYDGILTRNPVESCTDKKTK